ncbi:protein BTN1 isoform X2 [Exaiptasia diaphana]|uniref:Battenin n=1 Tax=Exaiptasia diaphana TaxID=2652724 RepID=A0A913XJP6_EXADI|nr:protein BTN1 isoform X2 [Exaiptasia diaphana]
MTSDVVAFLGFAVTTYIFFTAIIISAQDILAFTNIATPSIILCLNAPYFAMTLILPYYIDKLSLMNKAVASTVFIVAGVFIITLIPTPALRLFGVVLVSIGTGIAEMGFLSATSLHQDLTLHSFACGTGLGAAIGTLYMSGMTTIACIKPSIALQILLVLLPIYPLLAWHLKRTSNLPNKELTTSKGTHVEFTPLTEQDSNSEVVDQHLTLKEKFSAVLENLHLAVPLFIGEVSDFLITNAVITTIAFENSPFDPRDHFLYYQLTFWAAEFIGRSYGLVILWFKPSCTVVTNKTWIFSAIITANLLLLTCASWYRFLPNFYVAATLVAITGATQGALYLNTFAVAGKDKRPRHREFSQAFLTSALVGGVVAAALMGFYIEPKLKEHCMQILAPHDTLCFTRLTHGQWNTTLSCIAR